MEAFQHFTKQPMDACPKRQSGPYNLSTIALKALIRVVTARPGEKRSLRTTRALKFPLSPCCSRDVGEAQNMPAVAAGRCVLMHLSTKTGVCSTQGSAGLSSCAAKDRMRKKKNKKKKQLEKKPGNYLSKFISCKQSSPDTFHC